MTFVVSPRHSTVLRASRTWRYTRTYAVIDSRSFIGTDRKARRWWWAVAVTGVNRSSTIATRSKNTITIVLLPSHYAVVVRQSTLPTLTLDSTFSQQELHFYWIWSNSVPIIDRRFPCVVRWRLTFQCSNVPVPVPMWKESCGWFLFIMDVNKRSQKCQKREIYSGDKYFLLLLEIRPCSNNISWILTCCWPIFKNACMKLVFVFSSHAHFAIIHRHSIHANFYFIWLASVYK